MARDTVRWVLAEGKSLQDGVDQWHVYLKPTRPGLETNLAINTDHHAYMLELHSYEETYMAVVTWRFPQEEIAKLQAESSKRPSCRRLRPGDRPALRRSCLKSTCAVGLAATRRG